MLCKRRQLAPQPPPVARRTASAFQCQLTFLGETTATPPAVAPEAPRVSRHEWCIEPPPTGPAGAAREPSRGCSEHPGIKRPARTSSEGSVAICVRSLGSSHSRHRQPIRSGTRIVESATVVTGSSGPTLKPSPSPCVATRTADGRVATTDLTVRLLLPSLCRLG